MKSTKKSFGVSKIILIIVLLVLIAIIACYIAKKTKNEYFDVGVAPTKGPQGVRGIPGEKGPDGNSASINSYSNSHNVVHSEFDNNISSVYTDLKGGLNQLSGRINNKQEGYDDLNSEFYKIKEKVDKIYFDREKQKHIRAVWF